MIAAAKNIFRFLKKAAVIAGGLVVIILATARLVLPETGFKLLTFAASAGISLLILSTAWVVFRVRSGKLNFSETSQLSNQFIPVSVSALWLAAAFILLGWGSGALGAYLAPLSAAPVSLLLRQIPDISKVALAQSGVLFRVSEPIPYIPRAALASFDVEILADGFQERNVSFVGDGARFNEFVSEVQFVSKNRSALLVNVATGVGNSFQSLWNGVKQLFTTNPLNTLGSLKDVCVAALSYSWEAVQGKRDIVGEAQAVIGSAYISYLSKIGADAGINFSDTVTPEASQAIEAVGQQRIAGMTATETALLIAPFMCSTKAVKVAGPAMKFVAVGEQVSLTAEAAQKATRAAEVVLATLPEDVHGNLLRSGYRGVLAANAGTAETAIIAKNIVSAADLLRREQGNLRFVLSNLADPIKLASLKGARPANSRYHKILYYMHESEKAGIKPAKVLDACLPSGTQSEFFYAKAINKSNLMENYANAKDLGIFDTTDNRARMRRGLAPRITRGPSAGQIVEVDHIIPRATAPELSSNLGNLRYLPESVHASRPRPPVLDSVAVAKMNEFKAAGWSNIGKTIQEIQQK